jgi:DNA-directed RNA polymerase specialized sigma24 family protein
MSPPSLRRYRAERLLRSEFDGLRSNVLAVVAKRLALSGTRLAYADLEACYAQAWQGLYSAILEGEQIENPTGWLVLVTFRRALDEHRSRTGLKGELGVALDAGEAAFEEPDLAGELDDRVRLRQVLEALRGRLSDRECQAAALCYVQGLSRSEAASCMGISEGRMRKLMDGKGPGRPGVSSKVFELLGTIQNGDWCEEQASLMRALAFGVLDPEGDRYMLAVAHRRECPGCRRYVLLLRGLAAVLPPVALPWKLGDVGARRGLARPDWRARPTRRPGVRPPSHSSAGAGLAPAKVVVGLLTVGVAGAGVVLLTWSQRTEAHRHGGGLGAQSSTASGLGAGPLWEVGLSAFGLRQARARTRAKHPVTAYTQSHAHVSDATREFGPERGSKVARERGSQVAHGAEGDLLSAGASRPPPGRQGPPATQARREFGIE